MKKNKNRIKQLISQFFDKLPNKEKHLFSSRVFELFLEDLSITEIEINHLIGYDFLIIYGCMEDLSDRSEERRVGKECRSRWSPYH